MKNPWSLCFLFLSLVMLLSQANAESGQELHLYLDADLTGAASSSMAIEQGIRTALSQVDNKLGGRKVVLVTKNHHGNSRRSLDNLKEYLADEQALAVFSGLHSPPLLDNLDFINTSEVLTLVPWAAAGPITRYPSPRNWIFRLSVDDTKAGKVITEFAVKVKGAKSPALLLEDTGWGRSNSKTISKALNELSIVSAGTFWFNWGVTEQAAGFILKKITLSGADSIIFVANSPEAKNFVLAMDTVDSHERLPIFSHWGLTGGDFPEVVTPELRKNIELMFLQTSFSFMRQSSDPFVQKVLAQAKTLYPQIIRNPEDIRAPNGFVHAYDLTRLLIAAVNQAGLSGEIKNDRRKIRKELENLRQPVHGLLKTYRHPFGVFHEGNPDAHEALTAGDLAIGHYGSKNEILLLDGLSTGSKTH